VSVEICQNENFFAVALFLQVGVIYGKDHRICRAWQFQKNGEVDTSGRTWEGDSVQLAAKEVGLMLVLWTHERGLDSLRFVKVNQATPFSR